MRFVYAFIVLAILTGYCFSQNIVPPFPINKKVDQVPSSPSHTPWPWAKTYSGTFIEEAKSISQVSDGGYIVCGTETSFGTNPWIYNFWVMKLINNGKILWEKSYDGGSNDYAEEIKQTSDGGYIIAGSSESFGSSSDIWVIKLIMDGSILWQKAYVGASVEAFNSIVCSVFQTFDGAYAVAGTTQVPDIYFPYIQDAFWVLKLAYDGSIIWQKAYSIPDNNYHRLLSCAPTGDGGFILGGVTGNPGTGQFEFYVLRLAPDGKINWQKNYGKIVDTAFTLDKSTIMQTYDGGYAFSTSIIEPSSHNAIWLVKLSPDGSIIWQKSIGDSANQLVASSLFRTTEGGFVVSGSLWTTNWDYWVMRLYPDGQEAWQKSYGGMSNEYSYSIFQTGDNGGYAVAGFETSFTSSYRSWWILKLNPSGLINFNQSSGAHMIKTNVTVVNTNIVPIDAAFVTTITSATPINTNATVKDTNCTVKQQAP